MEYVRETAASRLSSLSGLGSVLGKSTSNTGTAGSSSSSSNNNNKSNNTSNLSLKSPKKKLSVNKFKFFAPRNASQSTLEQPALQLPYGIGDSSWLDGLHHSGLLNSVGINPNDTIRSESAPTQHTPSLSTLSLAPNRTDRPSLDSTNSASSPTSSASTTSTMRRQTKTPIFRIGHSIEKKVSKSSMKGSAALSRRAAADAAGKTRSIDLIAGQYQALLESRDALEYEALFGDMSPQGEEDTLRPVVIVDDGPPLPHISSESYQPHRPAPPARLPTNDGRAVIGFEEDVIYFKPISFPEEAVSETETKPEPAPEPSKRAPSPPGQQNHSQKASMSHSREASPHSRRGSDLSSTSDTNHSRKESPSSRERSESLSPPAQLEARAYRSPSQSRLQRQGSRERCEDLLAKEMTASIMTGRSTPSAEESALQLGVMIKTYEKLRDQVAKNTEDADAAGMKNAFDSWLKALHTVHDNIVDQAAGQI